MWLLVDVLSGRVLFGRRFGEVSTVIILGGMKGVNGQNFDRDDSRACLVGSGGIAVLVRG